jgi:hypothetical protein
MGLETNGEAYLERPDKTFSMISLAAMGSADFESGVNGDIVWQNNPQMGLRLLKGEERRGALMASRLDPFSAWKQLWEKAEMAGEETVGEASCYKVVLTPAEGEALSVWFDTGTGLVVQQEIAVPATGGTVLTQFSDYRDVHGIKAAHRIEQQGLMHWVMEVTEVRYNVDDIPEGVFDLPPRIEEMAGR